jgi:hypothetical protein
MGAKRPQCYGTAYLQTKTTSFWGARCAAWPVVKAPPKKKPACHALDDLYGQDSVRSSDGFDGMYNEGDSDGLDYY